MYILTLTTCKQSKGSYWLIDTVKRKQEFNMDILRKKEKYTLKYVFRHIFSQKMFNKIPGKSRYFEEQITETINVYQENLYCVPQSGELCQMRHSVDGNNTF